MRASVTKTLICVPKRLTITAAVAAAAAHLTPIGREALLLLLLLLLRMRRVKRVLLLLLLLLTLMHAPLTGPRVHTRGP